MITTAINRGTVGVGLGSQSLFFLIINDDDIQLFYLLGYLDDRVVIFSWLLTLLRASEDIQGSLLSALAPLPAL